MEATFLNDSWLLHAKVYINTNLSESCLVSGTSLVYGPVGYRSQDSEMSQTG